MTDAGSSLTLDRITVRHGRTVIVDALNLMVGTGITALLGPNGAGKTTLLQSIGDPRRIHHGSITAFGAKVATEKQRIAYAARLGYMPQHWEAMPRFSALESVAYTAWLKGIPSRETSSAAEQALGFVGLADHLHTRVDRMSGGMRQRVGLAETLVNDPGLVLLDEPTVGLDPEQRAVFREHILAGADDRTILFTTHLTDDVEMIADRVLVMREGYICFDGTPQNLAALGTGRSATTSIEDGYLSVMAQTRSSSA